MNKLKKMTNIIDVHVVSFSKGSIVAEFKLTLNENGEAKEAFEMLKEGINDGKIGTLRVDPSSLVLIPSATEEPIKELTHEIIIGGSLGGLFVVVLCTIFFVCFCKNKNAAHTRIQSELQTTCRQRKC
ncbi:uncharacterized protein LOC122959264 [Acropora millepora]|nr:uncharacterized protein LOC122959264 [Acropora millepora]